MMMMDFPKTAGQCKYVLSLTSRKSVVIATGPAGTGKTLLACHEALKHIGGARRGRVVLTRPIVAADEDMGYLPGTMEKKMEPWTRPMYDVFEKYLSMNQIERSISIEPLGYMRGRTFNNTYIIADEMQNSTVRQMTMLLTRVGENTKLVVTGDLDQSDLGEDNGLAYLVDKVSGLDLEHIDFVKLTQDDVLRSPAVEEVLKVMSISGASARTIVDRL